MNSISSTATILGRSVAVIRAYFLNLTSRRAVLLFLMALGAGAILIVANVCLPWSPPLIVVIYGSVLLVTAKFYRVPHSDMTNNSPYFLAFLFFLLSLATAFWNLRLASADLQLGDIVHQLGGALIATIVGIPFRQLLFAYSPEQADQDLYFRALEEELRRSATEFKRSQAPTLQCPMVVGERTDDWLGQAS